MRAEGPKWTDPRDSRRGWPFVVQDVNTIPGLTNKEKREYKKFVNNARADILAQERLMPKVSRESTLDIAALALEVEMEDQAAKEAEGQLNKPSKQHLTQAGIEACTGSIPFEAEADTTVEAEEVALSGVQRAHQAALERRRSQEEQLLARQRELVYH
jgi:hypothetical protein